TVQHDFGVAVDAHLQWIVAAKGFGIDIDLDGGCSDLWNRPKMRGHPSGLAPDEADEVGTIDDPVRAFARVGADDADRQGMGAGYCVLAVERGCDWDLQQLRERHQLGAGTRGADAAAGNKDRPLSSLQQVEGGEYVLAIGLGSERRNTGKLRF